jgi:hypothetical protein
MGNFGLECERIVDFDSRNIKLKLCFREDCEIDREKWMVSESFYGCSIGTNVYPFPKI